ncbi:unnamed protein product [Caretta caretta]
MESIEVQNTQCEMKTDLNLLLECLKYQMDSPASQKEALVTIYSICQQNSEASDYFREIGGLMFVNDLAKSSVHCIVKEAALFTLAVVMESNVYCQQTLCTSELFEDLIFFLTNKNSSVNLKRMSVYVILVLVSNNKSGQIHIRETGCIGVLLQLFRTTLSISEMNLSDENINQYYQLWSSVCSTLCACVNNPQNEDNQNTCCSVFPHAKDWLQSCIKPEIVRPICSFVGLTVANNSRIQEYFVSVGGLDILAEVLIKLVRDSSRSYSSAKLAVVVTKTLDACIADNSAVGDVLVKYHIVSKLLRLLTYDTLDSGEKISIILTLGHCTEGCEENQYDLLQNNGLPLMIQLLTESQDEEVNKAATFVLQNCKQITEKLSLKINEYSLNLNDAEQLKMDLQIKERNLEDYWKKVKEILHRIELLEKEHDEETVRRQIFVDIPREAVMQTTPKYRKMNASDPKANTERTHTKMQCSLLNCKSDDLVRTTSANNQSSKNGILKTVTPVDVSTRESEQNVTLHSADKLQTGSVQKGHTTNERTACEKKQCVPQASEHLFKQPSLTVQNLKQAQVAEILLTPAKKGRLNTESSTFKSRKNLQENFRSICLTPMKKTQSSISNIDDNLKKNINFREKYNLMPTYTKTLQTDQDTHLKKQTVKETHNTEYQGLNEKNKYSFDEDERTESLSLDTHARALKKNKRRIRKDFTTEEVNYLLSGIPVREI